MLSQPHSPFEAGQIEETLSALTFFVSQLGTRPCPNAAACVQAYDTEYYASTNSQWLVSLCQSAAQWIVWLRACCPSQRKG